MSEIQDDFGPAMLALSERQRAFVVQVVHHGVNYARAYHAAGYEGDPTALKNNGSRLARRPDVIAAIQEEGSRAIRGHVATAISTLVEISSGSHYSPRDRTRASEALLDRGGFGRQTEHKVTVERPNTVAEQVARIRQMAKDLGIDPRELLGQAGVVVDADFKLITGPGSQDDPGEWAVEPGVSDDRR